MRTQSPSCGRQRNYSNLSPKTAGSGINMRPIMSIKTSISVMSLGGDPSAVSLHRWWLRCHFNSFLSLPELPSVTDSWALSLSALSKRFQGPQVVGQQASTGRRSTQTRTQAQTSGAPVQSPVCLRRSGHGRAQLQRWWRHRHHQRGWDTDFFFCVQFLMRIYSLLIFREIKCCIYLLVS